MTRPCVTFIYTVAGAGLCRKIPIPTSSGWSPSVRALPSDPVGQGPAVYFRGKRELLWGNSPPSKGGFPGAGGGRPLCGCQSGEVDIALTSATLAGTEIDGMRVVSVDSVDNRGSPSLSCRRKAKPRRTLQNRQQRHLRPGRPQGHVLWDRPGPDHQRGLKRVCASCLFRMRRASLVE